MLTVGRRAVQVSPLMIYNAPTLRTTSPRTIATLLRFVMQALLSFMVNHSTRMSRLRGKGLINIIEHCNLQPNNYKPFTKTDVKCRVDDAPLTFCTRSGLMIPIMIPTHLCPISQQKSLRTLACYDVFELNRRERCV